MDLAQVCIRALNYIESLGTLPAKRIWSRSDNSTDTIGLVSVSLLDKTIWLIEYSYKYYFFELIQNFNFRSLDGLDKFPFLEELILDNNFVDDNVVIPSINTLNTLSLNKNKVSIC